MVNRFLPPGAGTKHLHGNPGFWMDRGLRSFELEPDPRHRPDSERTHEREAALRDSLISMQQPSNAYISAYRRRVQALDALPGITDGRVCTVDRGLLIGASSGGVLDVSMTMLRPWGLPYIPGSALKGIAKTYAEQVLAREDPASYAPPPKPGKDEKPIENAHSVLFGSIHGKGYVIWHDAWLQPPLENGQRWKPFRRQVLTNHHPDYYGGQDAWPTDFDDTRPIGFLTAHESFVVSVTGPDQGWVDLALGILTQALEAHGVGGNLTGGFGTLEAKGDTWNAIPATPALTPITPMGSASAPPPPTPPAQQHVPQQQSGQRLPGQVRPQTPVRNTRPVAADRTSDERLASIVKRIDATANWKLPGFGNAIVSDLKKLFADDAPLAAENRQSLGKRIVEAFTMYGRSNEVNKPWLQTAQGWRDGHDG